MRPGQAVEDRQAARFSRIFLSTIPDHLLFCFPLNESFCSRQAARAERLASRRPTQPPAPEPAEMDVDDERPNQNQAQGTTTAQVQPNGLPQPDQLPGNARTQQEAVRTTIIVLLIHFDNFYQLLRCFQLCFFPGEAQIANCAARGGANLSDLPPCHSCHWYHLPSTSALILIFCHRSNAAW